MEEEVLTDSVKSVVQSAVRSLARCEQCRSGLERKLRQKEFSKEDIKAGLDYLERKGFLSDERYASAWVRNHCAFRFHGRIRLMSELISRGIDRSLAQKTIEEYFSANDELDLCKKAAEKYIKAGKNPEKVLKLLEQSGFSYSLIQKAMKNL